MFYVPPMALDGSATPWDAKVKIEKVDEEKRLAFGWLYVCRKANGEAVVDHSGETISIDELEGATYKFAEDSRKAGLMHRKECPACFKGNAPRSSECDACKTSLVGVAQKAYKAGTLVEIVCFTAEKRKAMGIPEGVIPDGTWVGFKLYDDEAWEGVKSRKYKMLSLGGKAIRRVLAEVQ